MNVNRITAVLNKSFREIELNRIFPVRIRKCKRPSLKGAEGEYAVHDGMG